ncbi:diacylglycerol kinase family lipid kinase [Algoriphagus jejuensis]|uniref:Diacylglycerol kinase family lipid kinase n=1 Tax=Algoriphagus jejuensis TaxID=419934 RepID=A0ABN1N5T4_9BACT
MEAKALLIFNPNAGSEEINALDLLSKITVLISGTIVDIYETTGDGDQEAIKEKLANTKYALVVIAGGDGTIKLGAACVEDQCPMAILPLGSANGLANCLGIKSLDDAWDALKQMDTLNMDGVMVDDHLCLHLADFGFNANLIHRFEEGDSRGMIGYVKSSLGEIFSTNISQFVLETDGEKIEFEAHMLVIANGDRYGTGAVINPDGDLSDGRFEVIAVLVEGVEDLIQLSIGLISGERKERNSIRSWTLKNCKIQNHSGAKFQIDGELMGTPSEITVGIRPGIFRFVHKTPDVVEKDDVSIENSTS